MIIGRCGLADGWNGMVGLGTKVNTVLPSMLASKWPEAAPERVP